MQEARSCPNFPYPQVAQLKSKRPFLCPNGPWPILQYSAVLSALCSASVPLPAYPSRMMGGNLEGSDQEGLSTGSGSRRVKIQVYRSVRCIANITESGEEEVEGGRRKAQEAITPK